MARLPGISPLDIGDLRKKYGEGNPTDVSAHHPDFIGYSFSLNGHPVGVKADSKTDIVLSVSIDYTYQVVKKMMPNT